MKKRYSNFHRARKWHRKCRNILYDPEGVRVWLCVHYSNLYYKYKIRSEKQDLTVINHVGSDDRKILVLRGFK